MNSLNFYRFLVFSVIENDRLCHVTVSSNPLHVMRKTKATESCGSRTQPWLLEAPLGQQISISLFDFGSQDRAVLRNEHQTTFNCLQLGYIVDKFIKKNVSICGGAGQERSTVLYRSASNVVEIVLNAGDKRDNMEHYGMFLLRFTCKHILI